MTALRALGFPTCGEFALHTARGAEITTVAAPELGIGHAIPKSKRAVTPFPSRGDGISSSFGHTFFNFEDECR